MLKNRAQSLSEYSICLAVILVALITINFYVKRGLQGRYKDLVDKTTVTALAQGQYEPDYKESNYTNMMGRKTIGTTKSLGGNFRRDLPSVEDEEQVNYMSVGGTSKDDVSAKAIK